MQHELRAEVDLEATPEEVWRQLVDVAAYGDWNPFITSAAGTVAVGERLSLRLQPPGGRAMSFRPTLTQVEPGRVLEWLGRVGMPGVFDGRHRFELAATPHGTRFVHSEIFTGVLVRLSRRSLDGATLAGFRAMNEALVRRVLGERATA